MTDEQRIKYLRETLDYYKYEHGELHGLLAEILKNDAVGRDCRTCEGTGVVSVTRMVGCGGPTNAYSESYDEDDCEDCFSGRVPR